MSQDPQMSTAKVQPKVEPKANKPKPRANKITRALRFEVIFPGWRKTDLIGPKNKKGVRKRSSEALWPKLWTTSDDITRAANRLIGVLWQLQEGLLPWPTRVDKGGEEKKIPLATLAYQALSGKWKPLGSDKLIYAPRGPRISGAVMSVVARQVHQRLNTDITDVRRGKRSLASFRTLPIPLRAAETQIDENGNISVSPWPSVHLTLRPRKLGRRDRGQRAILQRIAKGELKLGNSQLFWDQPPGRKGRWMLSVPWTGHVLQRDGDLVAGVHLGMTSTASIAYLDRETGALRRAKDIIQIPENAFRSRRRLVAERRERLRSNSEVMGLREGRGRARKLRVDPFADRMTRIRIDAVRQVASAVVKAAIARGASAIGVEDLTQWSVAQALDELPRATNKQRAKHRKWYFSWLQGSLRPAIIQAAEREGLAVYEIDAAWDSRTCANCGRVYKEPHRENDKVYGRYEWRSFRCVCGYSEHADRNAAVVVAQRTLTAASQ